VRHVHEHLATQLITRRDNSEPQSLPFIQAEELVHFLHKSTISTDPEIPYFSAATASSAYNYAFLGKRCSQQSPFRILEHAT
jgi:hypothetical protein